MVWTASSAPSNNFLFLPTTFVIPFPINWPTPSPATPVAPALNKSLLISFAISWKSSLESKLGSKVCDIPAPPISPIPAPAILVTAACKAGLTIIAALPTRTAGAIAGAKAAPTTPPVISKANLPNSGEVK